MKTLLLSILISILILLEPLSFAHGDMLAIQDMNVYTNKDSYGKGEVIKISGEIDSVNGMTISKDIPITIILTNNVLQKTMQTLKTYPSANGNFAVAGISTTDPSWKSSGTYTVYAFYGNFANATTTFSFEMGDSNLLAPLKQSKLGVSSDKIECRSDLQSIIKSEDNSTACVTQQTVQTLVKRGWAIETNLLKSPLGITESSTEYSVGQPINAVVNYTGYVNGGIYPDVKILNADNGSKVWYNCAYPYYTHTELAGGGRFGTFTYNVRCSTQYPIINETGNYIMIASLYNNIAKARFTVIKPMMLPASFEPCDIPYPQSNTGVAVLYMPANSVGKICVKYSNYNTFPIEPAYGIGVFDPNNSYQNVKGITIWHDPILNPIIKENSTLVVYHIKTGNQTGFYGLSVPECRGTPFAVGYDNNSKIISSDFPFLGASSCAAITYTSDIDSLSNIGIKYIPNP